MFDQHNERVLSQKLKTQNISQDFFNKTIHEALHLVVLQLSPKGGVPHHILLVTELLNGSHLQVLRVVPLCEDYNNILG